MNVELGWDVGRGREGSLFRDSPPLPLPLPLFPRFMSLHKKVFHFAVVRASKQDMCDSSTAKPVATAIQIHAADSEKVWPKLFHFEDEKPAQKYVQNAEERQKSSSPGIPHGLAKARMTCHNLFAQLFASDGLSLLSR